jgi:AraC-like DNA-binding protein
MRAIMSGEVELRRPAAGVEMRAGVAPAGRTPRVVSGDDLLLVLAHPGARVRCRRRVDGVPPTLLSVVEDGDVVAADLPAASDFRALLAAPGVLAELSPRLRALTFRSVCAGRRMACVAAGRALCDAADAVDGEEALRHFVERVLAGGACAVRIAAEERMEHAVVRRVRDHLRAGYARRITLEELGRVAGMCRFALVRAFTREIGMPPHAYQTQLRVARAATLIAAGGALSDVALEVGFTDQSHLSRNFKCIMGIPPGRYGRSPAPRLAGEARRAA